MHSFFVFLFWDHEGLSTSLVGSLKIFFRSIFAKFWKFRQTLICRRINYKLWLSEKITFYQLVILI